MNKLHKFFNTAGPIKQSIHYFIDPLQRFNLEEIELLIDRQKYFTIYAPRQSGKTSFLIALMNYLNNQGKYKALYVSVENAQAYRENIQDAMTSILMALAIAADNYLGDSFIKDNSKEFLNESGEFDTLEHTLGQWCLHNEKPIVLLIDEINTLVGDTLISVLRQIRSGYIRRPNNFPQSIVLCGVHDVKDYRIHSDKEKSIITGGSVFNIKAQSLRLGNFSLDEIKTLYLQHSEETGQLFSEDVFPLIWNLTEGQPWLVNALAYEVCFEMKEGRNRDTEITVEMINRAKERMILERHTHLDQLSDKLKEERVRRVIEPILAGSEAVKIPDDDVDYVIDLGLIKKERMLRIANRIYHEAIHKSLKKTEVRI